MNLPRAIAGGATRTPFYENVGTEVRYIFPTSSNSSFSEATIDAVGVGLVIVSGAGSNHRHSTTQAEITFLSSHEGTFLEDFRRSRTFRGREVHNGAALVGNFQRVHVRWYTDTVPEPLIVRVILPGGNRLVPVAAHLAGGVRGEVIDFFDGTAFTVAVDGMTTVYDDGNPIALDGSVTPVAGDGIGDDFTLGFHAASKRRLLGWFTSTVAFKVYLQAYIGTTGGMAQLYAWGSTARAASGDVAGTIPAVEVVSLEARAASQDGGTTAPNQGQGIIVPPKICIRIEDTGGTTGLIGNMWLQFQPL